MRGRKPLPSALSRRKTPNEPRIPPTLPKCPTHLGPVARKEWRRLARPLHDAGVLTAADRAALAAYCQAWARWVEAEEKLKETPVILKTPSGYVQQSPWLSIANKQLELMGRYMGELGLTPSARTRLGRGQATAARDARLLARFTEVESGGRTDRPELGKALDLARLTGSTLVIAKLDRLSRNAAFLLTLRDSGVRFLACDMPEANDLTVGIMALIAEQERAAISRRTKEALAAAKARGVKLGNPKGAAALRRAGKGGVALRDTVCANADEFARSLAPVIDEIRAGGETSLRGLAAELNERGIETRRGGAWHVSNVRNLLVRLDWPRISGGHAGDISPE